MIKRFIILSFTVLFLFVVASCDKNNIVKESVTPVLTDDGTAIINNETEEEILALIDNKTASYDLVTQSYNIDLLRRKEFSCNLDEVDKIAKIECIRKVDNLIYTIHNIKEGGKLFLFYIFDEKSNSWITKTSWYYFKPLYKRDFERIEAGKTTIYDIGEIDPTAELYYLGQGTCSRHILLDNSIITIWYSNNIVKSIDCNVEPLDWIYKKILDIDWPT